MSFDRLFLRLVDSWLGLDIDRALRDGLRVEIRRPLHFDSHARKKCNTAAESALQPIVFARIEEDAEKHKDGRRNKKMQNAESPKHGAAKHEQCALHI